MTKSEKHPALLAPDWLTLPEAVARLGKSPSTLERLVAGGAVESKLEPRAGRKPERLYRAADLLRLAEAGGAANRRALAPLKRSAPALPAGSGHTSGAAAPERVSVAVKLWLTLEEAQAYSGLGEAYLRRLIDREMVMAVKGGPKGSWVIGRKSLEGYAGG